MFKIKNAIGYVAEENLLGEIAMVDIRNGMYVIAESEESEEGIGFEFDKVEVLEQAFEIHGVAVYNKDILGHLNGKQYQVEIADEDMIRFHELNSKLEIVKSGHVIQLTEKVIDEIENTFDIQGNYYELINDIPKNPEFTMEVVKDFKNGHYTYYYALNNKSKEEIDLVTAVFVMGGNTFGEYTRTTMSYDDYATLLEIGELVKVSNGEFMNYVTGASYDQTTKQSPFKSNADLPIETGYADEPECPSFEDYDDEEEDFVDDEEDYLFEDDFTSVPREQVKTCNTCKNEIDDCDCLWN
jgi:hypothetical protein